MNKFFFTPVISFASLGKGSMVVASLLLLVGFLLPPSGAYAQCPIYNMRAGGSIYTCGGSGGSFQVAMSGSSVGFKYQLILNGGSSLGDLVDGTGSGTMKWTVNIPGTYTVVQYGGSCTTDFLGGKLMNGSTVVTDLGYAPAVRINSQYTVDRCQGDVITYTAQNGTDYEWYNNGQLTAATGSTYTPPTDQPGTYIITVKGTNGCGLLESDNVQLKVGGYPTASIQAQGPTTFCQGGSVVLQVQSNGYSFEWLKDGQLISGATASTYAATQSGSYTFKARFNGNLGTDCPTESVPVTVSVLPLPTATISPSGNATIPFGRKTVSLSANAGSGYTYQWHRNGGLINGATGLTYLASLLGNYTVSVTDGSGCATLSSSSTNVTLENNYNYIISRNIQIETKNDGSPVTEDDLSSLIVSEKQESITYFDGLGRPMQQVSWQASEQEHDVVQPIVYDVYGREHKKYLPFTAQNNGTYKPNNEIIDDSTSQYIGIAQSFYSTNTDDIADDPKPYAETIFEPSPLNRVIKQGAPGEVWQPNADINAMNDKTLKNRYEFNEVKQVLLFTYNRETGAVGVTANGELMYYDPNQLYANKTYDEASNEIIEYMDKDDKIICKKVQYKTNEDGSKQYAQTYYIYDDIGRLIMVLPPEGVKELISNY